MNTVPPLVDRVIFHLKHWQVFALMVAGVIASKSLGSDIRYFFLVVHFIWIPVIGVRLNKFLPKYYSTHYKIFLGVWFAMFVVYLYMSFTTVLPKSADFVIVFCLWVIFFFTMLSFVARGIKSLQTRDRSTVNDYFVDIFLLWFFFPFGVWIIQPRLNLLGDQYFGD